MGFPAHNIYDRYVIVDTYQTEYSSRKTLIKDKVNDKLTDYRTGADSEHGWDAASKTTLGRWNEQKYEGISVALMEIHVLRHIEEQQKAKENKRHTSLDKQLVEARPNVGNTYASDKKKINRCS